MSAPRSADPKPIPHGGEQSGGQCPAGIASVRAAWVAAALFCLVAAFHAALVLGAPWGELTQGGSTTGALATSGRLVAAISCALLMVMAGAIVGRAGHGPFRLWPGGLRTALAWATTVYSLIAVVLNLITRSAAERALWAPVSLVLMGLVAFVMATTSRHRYSRRIRRSA
jgi:hypothetical protein